MPALVLGPMLRFTDETRATVWVETDGPTEVSILGTTTPTFHVEGHHYALVLIDGLDPGSEIPYDVRLDGEVAWPEPDDDRPRPRIRTRSGARTVLAFGSCRAAAPPSPPWNLRPGEHRLGRGQDALLSYARRMRDSDPDTWPDALLFLGDQVYADDASPSTRAFARMRRDTSKPPYEDVADLEEYTELYREAWSQPDVRWLLSTVPTAMIFDDHDMIDDWNISASWLADMRATDWWEERIVGGFASYWLYQHLGNLDPEALALDEMYAAVRNAEDGGQVLRRFALDADRDSTSARWSFDRDLGATHLVVVDSRAGRVLRGDAREERSMLDEAEWSWIADQVREPTIHLLVASSLPVLLPHAIDAAERWNEAVCAGAWTRLGRRVGERIRRALDLEHWPAFGSAFDRLTGLLRDAATGGFGYDPTTVAIVSGDVHNGYLAEAHWPGVEQPLWQAVASPMRQAMPEMFERLYGFSLTASGRAIGRAMRASARVRPPDLSWELVEGPVTANHIATLDLDEHRAHLRLEAISGGHPPRLETVIDRELSPR